MKWRQVAVNRKLALPVPPPGQEWLTPCSLPVQAIAALTEEGNPKPDLVNMTLAFQPSTRNLPAHGQHPPLQGALEGLYSVYWVDA